MQPFLSVPAAPPDTSDAKVLDGAIEPTPKAGTSFRSMSTMLIKESVSTDACIIKRMSPERAHDFPSRLNQLLKPDSLSKDDMT